MQYAKLGKTGITVSRICLGCMSYGDPRNGGTGCSPMDEARDHFATAVESGINFYDTADVYSIGVSEEITGRWLGEMAKRHEIVVATKVHGPMASGPNRAGLQPQTYSRGMRRVAEPPQDGFHRPLSNPSMGLHDADRGDARGAGFVGARGEGALPRRELDGGVAVRQGARIQKENGWHRFVSMQNHYNLVYREEEREMNPLCIDNGVGLIPWSPLARGFLAGNREKGGTGSTARAKTDDFARNMYFREYDFEVLSVVEQIAKAARGHAVANRVRVDPAGAGSDRADYRSDQNSASEGSDRGGRRETHARRSRGAGEAVPASSDSRSRAAKAIADDPVALKLATSRAFQCLVPLPARESPSLQFPFPLGKAPPLQVPFPLGKGLGVRLSGGKRT